MHAICANVGHYRAGLVVVQPSSHQSSFTLLPYFTIKISSYTVQFQFFSYMTFFRGRQDSTHWQHTLMHSWVRYLFYCHSSHFLLLSAILPRSISLQNGIIPLVVSNINASIVALGVLGCMLSLSRWSLNLPIVLNGGSFFSTQSIVLHFRSSGEVCIFCPPVWVGSCCWLPVYMKSAHNWSSWLEPNTLIKLSRT